MMQQSQQACHLDANADARRFLLLCPMCPRCMLSFEHELLRRSETNVMYLSGCQPKAQFAQQARTHSFIYAGCASIRCNPVVFIASHMGPFLFAFK